MFIFDPKFAFAEQFSSELNWPGSILFSEGRPICLQQTHISFSSPLFPAHQYYSELIWGAVNAILAR